MNRIALALATGISLVLAACAGGGGGSPGGSPTPDGGDAFEHPAGSELVVRMEMGGGFVPREFNLSSVPTFTLLGDGRVIAQGAQTLIFPGPALPSLLERRLTEAGIQEVLDFIVDTGLFTDDAEFMGASNFVADAATTTFTVNAGGRTVIVSIYGLGTFAGGPGGPDLPAAEQVAHERLQLLSDRLNALESWLGEDAWAESEFTDHEPGAFRLYVRNADADPPDPSGIEPEERDWPLDVPLDAFGAEPTQDAPDLRCGTVSGEDAAVLFEELSQANQLTRWRSGESVYALIVRPLLPDEEVTCP